ncbi:MAG: hypothetical protein RMK57_07965 [Bryobacterales bacterium]|nr:hypothetical protein [Bryobacteraceae bacterium]MDW8354450.1 hypothetical protein [Bryobacterales bacterium]
MRTTLTLDDDVYEALVHLAKVSGRRLSEVASETLRRGLRPQRPRLKKGRRFPVFEVPPDAPLIPASRIQRVLDEEGAV